MALVNLIEESSAPLLLRDLYAGGDPGPIVGALAQVPELCEVTLPFVGAALAPSAVSFRDKEIAILRTSANLSCRYCIDAHTVVAFESGLSDTEVRALRRGDDAALDSAFATARDRALVAWIDALSIERGPVPPELGERARAALGEHQLVEVTVTVGATILLNRLASSLHLPTSDATIRQLADLWFEPFRPPTPVAVEGRPT
jgi:AhpD family alkylhydroperoxidase